MSRRPVALPSEQLAPPMRIAKRRVAFAVAIVALGGAAAAAWMRNAAEEEALERRTRERLSGRTPAATPAATLASPTLASSRVQGATHIHIEG